MYESGSEESSQNIQTVKWWCVSAPVLLEVLCLRQLVQWLVLRPHGDGAH